MRDGALLASSAHPCAALVVLEGAQAAGILACCPQEEGEVHPMVIRGVSERLEEYVLSGVSRRAGILVATWGELLGLVIVVEFRCAYC